MLVVCSSCACRVLVVCSSPRRRNPLPDVCVMRRVQVLMEARLTDSDTYGEPLLRLFGMTLFGIAQSTFLNGPINKAFVAFAKGLVFYCLARRVSDG